MFNNKDIKEKRPFNQQKQNIINNNKRYNNIITN